jgi:hypothetical protein
VRTVTLTELELCKDEIICTDQHEAEKYEFVFWFGKLDDFHEKKCFQVPVYNIHDIWR